MKHFKLFFALFAMLALGVGNAWGADVTYVFKDAADNPGNANDWLTADIDSYTSWSATKGGSNNPKYYNTGTGLRVYNGGTFTITSSKTLASITLTFSGTGYTFQSDNTTNPQTVTPNAKSYEWSVGRTCRLQKIEITYAADAGGETPGEGGGEDPETPGESDDATMTAGTNGTACTVNGKEGVKVGTSSKGGDMKITVPAGATMLHVYAAAWKGVTNLSLNITPTSNVTTTSIALQANDGIANSTPFTLSGDEADYLFDIPLQNITAETTLTFTSSTTKRFVVWGATYETSGSGSTEPVPSVTLDPSVKDFGTVNVGETPSQEFTITTKNTTASLTASIDNTTDYAVSTIAGNKVTVTYQPQSAGTHPAVLTVKAGEEATATVNLTGKAVQALEGTWILVTDASSIKAGDEIIIAAKESEVALSTTQASNNRPEVAITKNDNTITATSETQVLTLQAGNKENTLALYTGDGYLYAASSGSNYLRTETTLSDNSSWSIAVAADGTATLIAQGTNTRNTLYYNKNSKIFSCYSNAQQPIALYKNTNGKLLAGLAYATTKYLTKLGDAFTTPTLTNPNSLTVTYSSSDDNVATVAADGAVTIKAAGVVVITAAFAGDASYLEGSAKYTLCVTEHAGTQADPYSVADARRVIDVMETAEGVYATGIVSEIVTAYNSTYGNISYNISADGLTTSDQLQAYRGKSYNGANFTSADDVKVGDEVVIKGTLKKFSTTYEFDENNQLVSLNRTKEQAGLAYAETEHNANVGEDFAEPALTNPNNLTVTYSSSNTTLATVNATTGEVTILAAGKVTITATTAGDATYAAGSASYNITITNPGLAVATLPFAFNGNKAAIETTAGMTQNGLGSDYSASTAPNSQLKFDGTGDWVVIRFDSEPEKLSYDIKNNSFSGGKFSVQESADGETYTDVAVHTTITDLQSEEYELNSASRYVKFIYTTKSSGNVGLGNISITKADHRADAGLAWNPATVSLTVGDAFTAPTFSNTNSVSDITFTSDNEALATVTSAGVISLVSGKTGIATITATYAGNETYKAAEVTCVITVSPKSEKVVILAQYDGQWYAMKAQYVTDKTSHLAPLPVNYVGGKLYNVNEADRALIEWELAVVEGKATFYNDGKYLTGKSDKTDLTLATTACEWTISGDSYLIGTRTFLYNAENNWFRNFGTSNAGNKNYSEMPTVTAPVYATGAAYGRTVTVGDYGTICIPFGSNVGDYTGAEFYEISWMEMDGTTPKGIWLDQVNGALTAGKPYIFKATASEIAIVGDGTTAATPIAGEAGLTGTFTLIQDIETSDPSNTLEGNYMISGNQFLLCPAGCWLNANRAYIDATIIAGHTTKKAEIPGRRRVCMGENEATGLDQIVAPEGQAVKAIVNGQLIIIRDGVKYNVQGQKL